MLSSNNNFASLSTSECILKIATSAWRVRLLSNLRDDNGRRVGVWTCARFIWFPDHPLTSRAANKVYSKKFVYTVISEEKKSPQLPRGLGYTFAFEELQRNKLSLPLICKIVKISKVAFFSKSQRSRLTFKWKLSIATNPINTVQLYLPDIFRDLTLPWSKLCELSRSAILIARL